MTAHSASPDPLESDPVFGRRLVRFRLDPRVLTDMMHLPEGQWVEWVRQDDCSGGLMLFVAGQDFEPVPLGMQVPEVFAICHKTTMGVNVTLEPMVAPALDAMRPPKPEEATDE